MPIVFATSCCKTGSGIHESTEAIRGSGSSVADGCESAVEGSVVPRMGATVLSCVAELSVVDERLFTELVVFRDSDKTVLFRALLSVDVSALLWIGKVERGPNTIEQANNLYKFFFTNITPL